MMPRSLVAALALVSLLALSGSAPPPGPSFDLAALGAGLPSLAAVFVRPAANEVVYLPARLVAAGAAGVFDLEPGPDRLNISTALSVVEDTAEVAEFARRVAAVDPAWRAARGAVVTFALGLHLDAERVFLRERASGEPREVTARFVADPAHGRRAGTIQATAQLVYAAEADPYPYELVFDWKAVEAAFHAARAAAPGGAFTRPAFSAFVATLFESGACRAEPVAAAPSGGVAVTEEILRLRAEDALADLLLDRSGPPLPTVDGPAHPGRETTALATLPPTVDLTLGGFVERSLDLVTAFPFGATGAEPEK